MAEKAPKNRLYTLLDLSPEASDGDIKKAFRKLAMVWRNILRTR